MELQETSSDTLNESMWPDHLPSPSYQQLSPPVQQSGRNVITTQQISVSYHTPDGSILWNEKRESPQSSPDTNEPLLHSDEIRENSPTNEQASASGYHQFMSNRKRRCELNQIGDLDRKYIRRDVLNYNTAVGQLLISSRFLNSRPAHVKGSKRGTGGNAISLQANFFKILSAPDWGLRQYRVDFAPEEDRTIVRKGLLRLHKKALGTYMFDGSVMYTCNRYSGVSKTEAMELFSERQSDNAKIKVSIRLVGELVKGDPHYPQFFNIIARKGLEHLHLQLVGRNYFDARAKVEIPEYRFELWPGYQTSIRQHERDVLMGVEITHKVMRQENLLDILGRVRSNARGGDIQGACKAEVIGVTVLTGYNNNTYRIEDIDFTKNPKSSFKLGKEETSTTYIDYYRNKYGLTINNLSQPLLVTRLPLRDRRAGKDELLYLIPELCRATGLTDEMRTDYKLMAKLATFTRLNPDRRIDRLLHFNKRLQDELTVVEEFQQWNLKLDNKLVEIPARVIPPENIIFGNTKQSASTSADWTRHFRGARLIISTKLTDWVLIVPERAKRDAQPFIENLIKVGNGMSFAINKPQVREIMNDSAQSYAEELERIMSRNVPQLICCISVRSRADVYSAIKKKCCLDRPIPSQVILSKNLASKGAMSIATKIAIQINCKIGGAPWSLDFGIAGLMVVGFDVCHDPNQRGTDFGAMVASLDRGMTRYFSAVSAHKSNEELTNEFSINMVKALRKYAELNGDKLPSRIVVYRDGVGDGQIPYVLEHEVDHLREALSKLYGNAELVKLAFIIVTKRINTRLFYNRRENPPPGTIVDDVITNPWRYDFFIVSQCVRQGSVSPTAYNVIYDNVGLDVSCIQRLTFQLTHMYFNWSGTVRVPAPCQYAHKLAFLIAQSIHRPPSSHLESLLYFL
ncbi:Similar to Siwi: Piwi-like protein Siwi (Bombyx mori) [Cotesia congregata]|uniref:Similar to Siwi: Piwi-like protein Siwi (Bombyx mori) n=1 Tax=Cotesia congregata TaxID=51543 RepID=A0A8J2HH95_COTCN|nr:Similar to Siwi: Piwi-like protein Siwi (Bombyx mori) [Cotesia congregata]